MKPQIIARSLYKEFLVRRRRPGIRGAVMTLLRPDRQRLVALDDVSFEIDPGEIVGYVGPNGAGKSTTIKILCGILHPTRGEVRVDGLSPQAHRIAVVRRLGAVFGHRTQLYWDLRLGESFELLKRVYEIDERDYRKMLSVLDDSLALGSLLDRPVRQLSLGQRMRAEIGAAVLHSPSILLLDEPTVGLDVVAKESIRQFVLDLNRTHGTTVLLTTHDLSDVWELCQRLLVIRDGALIEDAPLPELAARLAPYRHLEIACETAPETPLAGLPGVEEVAEEEGRLRIRFDIRRTTTAELIARVSEAVTIRDLRVREPTLSEMLRRFYE
ncbi:MAG: ATP-binding cassette domain-containing protein [Gemmatimonadota bacterium]|jgi:ABC-2 type transport system ATP-binding protein